MRKFSNLLKSIISVALAVTLVLSMFSTAFAINTITEEEEILEYLYTFNSSVNSIKTKTPSFKYKKTAGLNKTDDIAFGSNYGEDIAEEAEKYLTLFVDALFNPEMGLVNNVIAVLTETDTSYTEEKVAKGADSSNLIPLRGEKYVSDLTLADDYIVQTEENEDLLNPENDSLKVRFTFEDCDLETIKASSLNKVFDLPTGSINPVIIGGTNFDRTDDFLDDLKFEDFLVHNAYVQADYNGEGELVKYTQNISYTFSLSFYDMFRALTLFTGVNFMDFALEAIANPILKGLGKPEVTPRDVLKNIVAYMRYDIRIELSDFDWTPRLFGDINNDGNITAYDARAILRDCVDLENLTKDEDLIHADVDFNGIINASDARMVLRMSVELEEKFNEVPEGESVKIVILTPPVVLPDEPEDDNNDTDDDSSDENGNVGGNPVIDGVADGISEFIDSIFIVINTISGDDGFVERLKEILKAP